MIRGRRTRRAGVLEVSELATENDTVLRTPHALVIEPRNMLIVFHPGSEPGLQSTPRSDQQASKRFQNTTYVSRECFPSPYINIPIHKAKNWFIDWENVRRVSMDGCVKLQVATRLTVQMRTRDACSEVV